VLEQSPAQSEIKSFNPIRFAQEQAEELDLRDDFLCRSDEVPAKLCNEIA